MKIRHIKVTFHNVQPSRASNAVCPREGVARGDLKSSLALLGTRLRSLPSRAKTLRHSLACLGVLGAAAWRAAPEMGILVILQIEDNFGCR